MYKKLKYVKAKKGLIKPLVFMRAFSTKILERPKILYGITLKVETFLLSLLSYGSLAQDKVLKVC